MSDRFSNVNFSNKLIVSSFSSRDITGTDYTFVNYDVIDSSIMGERLGIAICGIVDHTDENKAIFYLFGGQDSTGALHNDTVKIVVDATRLAVVESQETISCTTKPTKRKFGILKAVGSFLWLMGGIDEWGNLLYDLQEFSLIDNTWTALAAGGTVPSPRFMSGGLG